MAVELHVTDTGAGSDAALVLLHAFPLSSGMWAPQRRSLASTCRVLTPDQRGFGGSPLGSDPPSLDAVADDLAALLDRLGLDRVVLGGSSMGGYATMAFARRHPERLAGLVLIGTKASADPPEAAANRERIAAAVLADPSSTVLADEILPRLLGETSKQRRPEVQEQVRAQVAEAKPEAVAWAQRAMAARPDSLDVLRALDVPAVVVVGTEDPLSSVADAEAMAEALPDSRLVVVPEAGHLVSLEAPDAVDAAVRELLASVG